MSAAIADDSVPNVAIEWAFVGPDVRVSRYRCRAPQPGRTEEQSQPWHVIAFPHAGAFVHHDARGAQVVDAIGVLFLNAGAPYQTSHPFGCGDCGSALVLSADLVCAAAFTSARGPLSIAIGTGCD